MDTRPLRIVAWNCQGGLHKKTGRVRGLSPDIAVVSECAKSVVAIGDLEQVGWAGTDPNKGLGVFARPEFGGRVDSTFDPARQFFLPLHFEAIGVALLAVWAMNKRGDEPRPPYGRTHDALSYLSAFLKTSDLVIGDFNDNIRWDTEKEPSFSTTTRMLGDAGLENLFYLKPDEAPGSESVGSLYWRRDVDAPYLIDHAFLRRDRLPALVNFEIGSASEWLMDSDHMPLTIEIRTDQPGGE